jgi:hypothetical protein
MKVNIASCWFILYGYITINKTLKIKLLTSEPQNWITFCNLKPKAKPTEKDDVLQT